MAQNDTVTIRKRALIAKANRMMFLWVAGASVIVGFAAVGSIFLFQKIVFQAEVIGEKRATVSTLIANDDAIKELESSVRALNSNERLMSLRANSTDTPLQVILDALPSDANSLALGASLQNRLLTGVQGNVHIESIQVEPVMGVESLDGFSSEEGVSTEDADIGDNSEVPLPPAITLRFTLVGDTEALRQILLRLERSIRVIDIETLKLESRGEQEALVVQARAFYEPARVLEIRTKTVTPS